MWGAALTVMESALVELAPLPPVTCTVKLELPGVALTVPLMVPDELSVKPLGSEPLTIDQL
jgi:hypothetical protein